LIKQSYTVNVNVVKVTFIVSVVLNVRRKRGSFEMLIMVYFFLNVMLLRRPVVFVLVRTCTAIGTVSAKLDQCG
jgi:hypothetical protein